MGMKEEARVVQATRNQQLNLWVYSHELIIQAFLLDLIEHPELNELPDDVRLTVIVKGGPPHPF